MTTATIEKKTVFANELCTIRLNDDFTFSGSDKTDQYNDPRMYTKNTRSWKRGLKALEENFDENTTMYEAARLLSEVGLSARTYCAMD